MTPNIQSISPADRFAAELPKSQSASGFGNELSRQLDLQIQFSSHAQNQLKKRNINLNDKEISKLELAVSKLKDKNARESLVVLGDVALIVGIKNQTVITAMTTQSMKDNVITNIDSAIITV